MIPKTQTAVQLTGPDRLFLNRAKPIPAPGPQQVLAAVEAVGLCFSDLKLLKQFSRHARKQPILRGVDPAVLEEIPSYVPGDRPGVPGHEAVVRIVAAGAGVRDLPVGGRFLVQTDYRWLPTVSSNASFGYNFEGGLQEYVLMDQRIITSPDGDSMLIPAPENLSASAVALVEPWACVENAYASPERRAPLSGGRMLVAGDPGPEAMQALRRMCEQVPQPATLCWSATGDPPPWQGRPWDRVPLEETAKEAFDDVLFFGAGAESAETAAARLAARGLMTLAAGGQRFGRPVTLPVGRIHYGGCRFAGTLEHDPARAWEAIPPTGEVRPGDRVHIVGAGGPMGAMHVIRLLSLEAPGVRILATDVDPARLRQLEALAAPLVSRTGRQVDYVPAGTDFPSGMDYTALMAPLPELVAAAVATGEARAILNIFAGIPAEVCHAVDLDAYVARQMYFIGTSGSVLRDMHAVLDKVSRGRLDTNLSVAAVSGLEGAIEGIRAVEQRAIEGKIVVYPACRNLGLTLLKDLPRVHPRAAAALRDGRWTPEAEKELLRA